MYSNLISYGKITYTIILICLLSEENDLRIFMRMSLCDYLVLTSQKQFDILILSSYFWPKLYKSCI